MSIESVKHFSYSIAFMRLWNLDIETKECKKTKDSRDDIHETHSTIHFIGPF